MALTLQSMVYSTGIILDHKLLIFFGSYLSLKHCTNPAIHDLDNLAFTFPLGEAPSREEYLRVQSVCVDVFCHPKLVM